MTTFNALQRIKNELRSYEITLEDSGHYKFAPRPKDIRLLVEAFEKLNVAIDGTINEKLLTGLHTIRSDVDRILEK